MDKYSGMNKVKTTVKANDRVVSDKQKKDRGRVLKMFAFQTCIALLLGGILFLSRPVLGKATEKIKDAVCFGYVAEMLGDEASDEA